MRYTIENWMKWEYHILDLSWLVWYIKMNLINRTENHRKDGRRKAYHGISLQNKRHLFQPDKTEYQRKYYYGCFFYRGMQWQPESDTGACKRTDSGRNRRKAFRHYLRQQGDILRRPAGKSLQGSVWVSKKQGSVSFWKIYTGQHRGYIWLLVLFFYACKFCPVSVRTGCGGGFSRKRILDILSNSCPRRMDFCLSVRIKKSLTMPLIGGMVNYTSNELNY